MKFILLVAVIAVLIYIPTHGVPLPKEEKSSSVEEGNENEKSSRAEDKTVDTSEEVATKTPKKSTSEKEKSKSRLKNDEKNKKSVSTTPEPVIEEEEKQYYVMVPAAHGQMSNFKTLQPFNFKQIPKMPLQPQYVFKQPRVPSIPYTYPMFTSQDHRYPMMMEPETEVEYSLPNMMIKRMDDQPMYYIPPSRTGQSFANQLDHMNQINQSPFIFQNKETNPWNTYLESSGYYK